MGKSRNGCGSQTQEKKRRNNWESRNSKHARKGKRKRMTHRLNQIKRK